VKRLAGLIGLLLALVWAPALAAPTFPALTGRVVDEAHVLPADTQAALTAKLADLEQKTSRQLVVVTLPSLQGAAIEDFGYQLLRHWGIGQKGLNNGAILIVAPSEHQVRIEVGYGLEPVLTDALSSQILQRDAIPRFKAGDTPGGVTAATDSLIEQLSVDPSTAEARVAAAEQAAASAPRRSHGSGLGGILPLIIIFLVVSGLFRRRGSGGGRGRTPRGR